MSELLNSIAFIGPGGPEFIVVMLVLLLMFGAKDAPRMLRKINEVINSLRNTADGFKREIMYGDIHNETNQDEAPDDTYDYDGDYDYCDEERDYSDDTFENLEKDLEEGVSEEKVEPASEEEEDDARKD
jgi:Sec-independent protein translocase protein TatA